MSEFKSPLSRLSTWIQKFSWFLER